MAQLNPYVFFSGNCREALEFYKDCFGGELSITTVGESPMADQMSDKKENVMHGFLKSGDFILMASDLMSPEDLKRGNGVTLCVSRDSKKAITECFEKLSQGGKVTHPLADVYFGTFGDLTDKYGVEWMFQADKEA